MGVFRTAYVNVLPKTDQFDPELKKRLRRIDARSEGDRVGGTFAGGFALRLRTLGGVATLALGGVGVAAAAAAGGAAVFGLKTAASLEQAQIGFETLLGSAEKSRDFLTGLKAFAAKTPFELPGLIESSRTLLGVGLSAGQVIPTLRAFGDAAGAVGVGQENFQRIMLATSQAISAGKFQTEDLNQIVENGIPIWTILSRAMGKPVPEIRKMATEGKLLAKDVLPLLQQQMGKDYGGAMARQSQTLAGVWSTLKDTVAIGLADALKPLLPILSNLLPKGAELAGKALQQVSLAIAGFVAGTSGSGTEAEGIVGPMARLGAAARGVFDYFRAEVLPRLKEFAGFIREQVIPRVGEFAGFITGTVVPALRDLGGWIARNKDFFIPFVATMVGAVAIFKTITAVTALWAAAQVALNASFLANPLTWIVVAIAAFVAAIVVAYQRSETFRSIVQGAWQGIQTAVSFAWNNVIKPAVTALASFFTNVIAPAAMWLWRNVFSPAFTGIGYIVKAAWVVIQIALAAMKLYLENVIFPVIRFLWNNVVKPIFAGIGATISFTWNKIIKPVFSALGGFIRDNVAPAFRKGVELVGAAWNGIKAVAAKPVKFVIETVINKGIIDGINWVASKVGVKDRIGHVPLPKGIGDGYGHTGRGLPRGAGDGFGDLAGVLGSPAGWIGDRLTGPLKQLKARFGDNPLVQALLGAAGKVKGFATDKIQSLLSFFDIGKTGRGIGAAAAGFATLAGLQPGILGVLNDMRALFGSVPVISGWRPGATTLSGRTSYHASGRAIDIAPVQGWALYLNRVWGPRLRELITPWNALNILNGRPHRYTGAVWNQHNFAGGNAHIHAALANGGEVREPVFGVGRSGRTYSFGEVGTETVLPAPASAILDRLERIEAAVHAVAPGVGRELTGTAVSLRQTARAR